MRYSIKQLAENLAITPESKLDREGILIYLDEAKRRVAMEVRMGRNGNVFSRYVKAAELALKMLDAQK